jgi:hypothetical protein
MGKRDPFGTYRALDNTDPGWSAGNLDRQNGNKTTVNARITGYVILSIVDNVVM